MLAIATFSSVRSANRSARVAERSLLAGLRPVLIPSREDDPGQLVRFGDGQLLTIASHGAAIEVGPESVYMGMGVRNGGTGLAVIHGWRVQGAERSGSTAPDLAEFNRQQRDLYIPADDTGFWQGAIRDRGDPANQEVRDAVGAGGRLLVDVLYGDYEGGQRAIARFSLGQDGNTEGYRTEVVRYWNVDREDPRERGPVP